MHAEFSGKEPEKEDSDALDKFDKVQDAEEDAEAIM